MNAATHRNLPPEPIAPKCDAAADGLRPACSASGRRELLRRAAGTGGGVLLLASASATLVSALLAPADAQAQQQPTQAPGAAGASASNSSPNPASATASAGGPPAGERNAKPLPPVGGRLALPESFTLLDGSSLRAADLAGQVVVLYWWASWCPFCAEQSPLIDQLQRKHRAQGLRVLGLSIDKKPDDARAHLARKGYTFASTWVSPELARILPKPKGLPVTIVLGRDGRIALSESGQLFAEDIEAIAKFL